MTIVGYNWNGTPIYGNDDGSPVTTSKDVVITGKKKSGQTVNSLINAAPGILDGVANIVGSLKGNRNSVMPEVPPTPERPQNDNTIWYLAGGLILLILILVYLNR